MQILNSGRRSRHRGLVSSNTIFDALERNDRSLIFLFDRNVAVVDAKENTKIETK